MAAKQFGAVAREVIEAYGKDTMSHPVGTGPFMLKEWKQGNKIVLVANPNYRKVVFDGEPGAGGDPGDRGRAAALAARTRSRCDARSRWLTLQGGQVEREPEERLRPQAADVEFGGHRLDAGWR
nr:ABC transporter substrate-binding protein [Chromobacterium violaceum]